MNEILFITFAILCLGLVLLAFRQGKAYLFVAVAVFTILMNIFVLKQFNLFGMAITGGNVLYGALFLITDILSEQYGAREARRAVWLGFGTSTFFVVALQFLLYFTPNTYDFAQGSLQTLFSLSPRILIASMLSYFVVQHLDVYLYDKVRKLAPGKLWLRNNLSTLTSQALDTLLFTILGLLTMAGLGIAGVIPPEALLQVLLTTYAIKVLVAIIDTPFLYLTYKIKNYKKQTI
jgi:uncharacterized integral membrane protein (TIGR00697 family)